MKPHDIHPYLMNLELEPLAEPVVHRHTENTILMYGMVSSAILCLLIFIAWRFKKTKDEDKQV
jgi:hypothetical protein